MIMTKLSPAEIDDFVRYYIGFDDYGHLLGLGHPEQLRGFLRARCLLEIEPADFEGRRVVEKFVVILDSQPPQNQARILRAVLEWHNLGNWHAPSTRTPQLHAKYVDIIERLESETTFVESVSPRSSSEIVKTSLKDAEDLISSGGLPSAVALMHTALISYLMELCDEEGIQYDSDSSLTKVFKYF